VKWAECGYSKKDDKDQDVFVSEAICTILFISKPWRSLDWNQT